ncbi:MAG TPA: alpha/beta hydrolase [Candidatus Acidoferrales bacterium]|nr:alpha/beta hydrolase [Candidatus Acidoferrales bacterium]
MSIDPQARAYLDGMAAAGLPPVHELSAPEVRRSFAGTATVFAGEVIPLPAVKDLTLGEVPARLYSPSPDRELPVTVYFHGGGWVVGSLDTHDALCRRLAAASASAVVAVDYRLAPEHGYPAAVEDAWAALAWVAGQAGELGGDPGRIAVAGDSAGGNLAAAVAIRARDEGIRLCLQVLAYPVLDCDLDTPSYQANAEGFGLMREGMRWYWTQYCPDPARRLEPEASPLRAPDLAALAPAYVLVCDLDPLLDEGVAYARRLQEAGVPVRLRRETGMIHGFLRVAGAIDRAHDGMADIGGALRRAFAEPASRVAPARGRASGRTG